MAAFRRKNVLIGIPTLGTVSTRWAMAYAALCTPMNSACPRACEVGLPVDQARNKIARLAIDSDATHVLFVDDDVLIHPHALLQLLAADKDIVSGVYFTKGEFSEPLIFGDPGEGTMPYVPNSGLHEAYGHGMGLTLIRASVFREMRARIDLGTDPRGNPRWFYPSGDVPGEGLRATEDLWFLANAHEAGFKCFVDTHPYAFGWHFDARAQQGYPARQWAQYLESGRVEFEVPDRLMHLVRYPDAAAPPAPVEAT